MPSYGTALVTSNGWDGWIRQETREEIGSGSFSVVDCRRRPRSAAAELAVVLATAARPQSATSADRDL